MSGLSAFRNSGFKRWIAAGLAISWLCAVLTCAADGDLVAAAPEQMASSAADLKTIGPSQPDEAATDDCCQWQASTIVSLAPIKLPVPHFQPIASSLLLFDTRPVLFVQSPARIVRTLDDVRRRFDIFGHTLQAQAPPR